MDPFPLKISQKQVRRRGGMSRSKDPSIRTPPAKRIFHPRTYFCPRSHVLSIHTKKRRSGKRPNAQTPPNTLTQSGGGIVIFAQVKVSIKERMAKTHLQITPDIVQGGHLWTKSPKNKPFPTPGQFWCLHGGILSMVNIVFLIQREAN